MAATRGNSQFPRPRSRARAAAVGSRASPARLSTWPAARSTQSDGTARGCNKNSPRTFVRGLLAGWESALVAWQADVVDGAAAQQLDLGRKRVDGLALVRLA